MFWCIKLNIWFQQETQASIRMTLKWLWLLVSDRLVWVLSTGVFTLAPSSLRKISSEIHFPRCTRRLWEWWEYYHKTMQPSDAHFKSFSRRSETAWSVLRQLPRTLPGDVQQLNAQDINRCMQVFRRCLVHSDLELCHRWMLNKLSCVTQPG